MAGSNVDFSHDDAAFRAVFANVRAAVDGPGRRLFLSDVGEAMQTNTLQRAARQESPDGTPWVPLSPAYKARKDKLRPGVPMLKFDGHMLGDMFSWQLDGDESVLIGTNAIYGARQQEDRPFLGIAQADRDEIAEIGAEHILRAAQATPR